MRRATQMLAVVMGCVGLASGLARGAEKPESVEAAKVEAWRNSSRYFSNEANREFTRLLKRPGGDTRVTRLGLALSLLSVQPVVPENLDRARAELAALAKSDDEAGLAARYFQARIEQAFQEDPDYSAAAEAYRRLMRDYRTTYWGQLAIGKLAILTLYVLPNTNPAQRLATVEALLPAAGPVEARNLHMMLADAGLYYGQSQKTALAHLLAASKLTEQVPLPDTMRADLYIQIGDLSARAGELAQARDYLKRMEEQFPRDWRNWVLRQVIDDVAAGRKPAIP